MRDTALRVREMLIWFKQPRPVSLLTCIKLSAYLEIVKSTMPLPDPKPIAGNASQQPQPRLILTNAQRNCIADYYISYGAANTITDRNKVVTLATTALLEKFLIKKKSHRDSARHVCNTRS